MSRPKSVPEQYATVLPYLHVRGAAKAIDFYKAAFGAKSKVALAMPDGKVMHAEIEIGGTRIMLADEMPEYDVHAPQAGQPMPLSLVVYVANTDKSVEKAVAAGAKILTPPKDEFYGCRMAKLQDPFGHVWFLQQILAYQDDATLKKTFKTMMSAHAAPNSQPGKAPAKRQRK